MKFKTTTMAIVGSHDPIGATPRLLDYLDGASTSAKFDHPRL